jgi:hypothetical protein
VEVVEEENRNRNRRNCKRRWRSEEEQWH